ncbi:MAG TPA: hypothetical protein PK313_15435, partial [Myxococcota bacterium]|nr:hypothetical protein [Myxococcota bacterium]
MTQPGADRQPGLPSFRDGAIDRPPPDGAWRHPSRMVERPGPLLAWLGRAFFGAVRFDESAVATVRSAGDGAVPVYVLNVHSLLDYLYFNFAFLRL